MYNDNNDVNEKQNSSADQLIVTKCSDELQESRVRVDTSSFSSFLWTFLTLDTDAIAAKTHATTTSTSSGDSNDNIETDGVAVDDHVEDSPANRQINQDNE